MKALLFLGAMLVAFGAKADYADCVAAIPEYLRETIGFKLDGTINQLPKSSVTLPNDSTRKVVAVDAPGNEASEKYIYVWKKDGLRETHETTIEIVMDGSRVHEMRVRPASTGFGENGRYKKISFDNENTCIASDVRWTPPKQDPHDSLEFIFNTYIYKPIRRIGSGQS